MQVLLPFLTVFDASPVKIYGSVQVRSELFQIAGINGMLSPVAGHFYKSYVASPILCFRGIKTGEYPDELFIFTTGSCGHQVNTSLSTQLASSSQFKSARDSALKRQKRARKEDEDKEDSLLWIH